MWRMSAKCSIGPQGHRAVGEAQPDRSLRLHRPRQGAIVNDVVADGLDAAGPSSALRRASMQPPAAAAIVRVGSFTAPKGYSMSKKNTKAGIRKCSAAVWQDSRAISETRTRLPVFAPAPPAGERLSGAWAISASVNQRNSGARASAHDRTLVHRPEFAGPARRARRAGQHRQPFDVQRARQIGSAVIGLVVHQHDVKFARHNPAPADCRCCAG